MEPRERKQEYTEGHLARVQLVFGEGFLSPGGPDEARRLIDGVDLAGRDVLDVGCGVGGIDAMLASEHGARSVLGIDIEPLVLEKAREHVAREGLAGRVSFRLVEPGPFPLADASFDVVFSMGAMLHIPDKKALYEDVGRVLRPGGRLVAGDWFTSGDPARSSAMARFLAISPLTFSLATQCGAVAALKQAGFVEIELVDRNAWYREEQARELERIEGPLRPRLTEILGEDGLARWIEYRHAMEVVLDSGELQPSHLRAVKPGCGAKESRPSRC